MNNFSTKYDVKKPKSLFLKVVFVRIMLTTNLFCISFFYESTEGRLKMKVSRASGWPLATWAAGAGVRPGEDSPPGREPTPRPSGWGRAENDEETQSRACRGLRLRPGGGAVSVRSTWPGRTARSNPGAAEARRRAAGRGPAGPSRRPWQVLLSSHR